MPRTKPADDDDNDDDDDGDDTDDDDDNDDDDDEDDDDDDDDDRSDATATSIRLSSCSVMWIDLFICSIRSIRSFVRLGRPQGRVFIRQSLSVAQVMHCMYVRVRNEANEWANEEKQTQKRYPIRDLITPEFRIEQTGPIQWKGRREQLLFWRTFFEVLLSPVAKKQRNTKNLELLFTP